MMPSSPQPAPAIAIRFRWPHAGAEVLDAHPLLRACEAAPSSRRSVAGFDTAGHALLRQGACLRLRDGDPPAQCLTLHDPGSPFEEREWAWPARDGTVRAALLAEAPVGPVADGLLPAFTAEIERVPKRCHAEGGIVEIVLETGTLSAGGREEAVSELELRLRQGSPAVLYRLAIPLQAELGLALETRRWPDRVRSLLAGAPQSPDRTGAAGLPRDVTVGEAFRRMTGEALLHLLAHQPAAAAGVMEGVHGMRVGIRRLRALLVLFGPCLDPDPAKRFGTELRDLARILGEARDWDVFCAQTLADAGAEAEAETGALRDRAEAARAAAHRGVATALGQPGPARTVLGLAAWAEELAEAGSAEGAAGEPLRDLAPDLVKRLARKVRRRGRHIRHRSPEELHELRKALKKLRYAIEFLAPLHRGRWASARLRRCRRLQEELGAINDAAVATELAQDLARQDAALAPAAARLGEWADARRGKAHGRLHRAWRAFED